MIRHFTRGLFNFIGAGGRTRAERLPSEEFQYIQFVARDQFFAFALRWMDDRPARSDIAVGYLQAAVATGPGRPTQSTGPGRASAAGTMEGTAGRLQSEARRRISIFAQIADPAASPRRRRTLLRDHLATACGRSSPPHAPIDQVFRDIGDAAAILLADYERDVGALKMSTVGFVRQLKRFSEWVAKKQPSPIDDRWEGLNGSLSDLDLITSKIQRFSRTISKRDHRTLRAAYPYLGEALRNTITSLNIQSGDHRSTANLVTD